VKSAKISGSFRYIELTLNSVSTHALTKTITQKHNLP